MSSSSLNQSLTLLWNFWASYRGEGDGKGLGLVGQSEVSVWYPAKAAGLDGSV
ncbi:hypothetical protein N9L76_05750 [bacterium]|nr:hypothetical protein [bacterium]